MKLSDAAEKCMKEIRIVNDEYWSTDTIHEYDWKDWEKRVQDSLSALSPEERQEVENATKGDVLSLWLRKAKEHEDKGPKLVGS